MPAKQYCHVVRQLHFYVTVLAEVTQKDL